MVRQPVLRILQEVQQHRLPGREHIVPRQGVIIVLPVQEVDPIHQVQDQVVVALIQLQVEVLAEAIIQVVRLVVVHTLQDHQAGRTHRVHPVDLQDLPVVRILPGLPVEVIRRVALLAVAALPLEAALLPGVVHRPVHHVRADKIKI